MLDDRAIEARDWAKVTTRYIGAPLKYWVLLRKNSSVCALRFDGFRHERAIDGIPSSATSSFYATYEWYYQRDGSQDLKKSNVRTGHGEASRLPNIWRIERGTRFVDCGSIRAQWSYPHLIYLIDRNYRIAYDPKVSDQPNNIEIALTGWRKIEDVDATDPRLVWYRYDHQRDWSRKDEEKNIRVDDLPGAR